MEMKNTLKFTYWDNSNGYHVGGMLFTCTAEKLTDADVLFKAATGLDAMKMPNIGATVERII